MKKDPQSAASVCHWWLL